MYKQQDNCKRKILHIHYLVMHSMQMHTGAISWLEYGSCVRTSDNPLAYARDLFPYRIIYVARKIINVPR